MPREGTNVTGPSTRVLLGPRCVAGCLNPPSVNRSPRAEMMARVLHMEVVERVDGRDQSPQGLRHAPELVLASACNLGLGHGVKRTAPAVTPADAHTKSAFLDLARRPLVTAVSKPARKLTVCRRAPALTMRSSSIPTSSPNT